MLRLVSRCKARCARGGRGTAADSSSHEPHRHARTAIGGPSHCASWSLLLSVARADWTLRGRVLHRCPQTVLTCCAGHRRDYACALMCSAPADGRSESDKENPRLACAPTEGGPANCKSTALCRKCAPRVSTRAPRAESPRSGAVTRV